jgi:hypothetical protein
MLLGKISETLLGKRLDPFGGRTRHDLLVHPSRDPALFALTCCAAMEACHLSPQRFAMAVLPTIAGCGRQRVGK